MMLILSIPEEEQHDSHEEGCDVESIGNEGFVMVMIIMKMFLMMLMITKLTIMMNTKVMMVFLMIEKV